MSNGGAAEDGTARQDARAEEAGQSRGGVERGGRLAWLRRHRLLASAVGLALVAGAVAVPLTLTGDDSCKELPATTRALAPNPAAATRALDPGDDMSRLDTARALLPTGELCGDGGRVLGQVVDAATRATAPGRPHTLAQARAVYLVAVVYDEGHVPSGAAPGLARMFAGYVVDTNRFVVPEDNANTPAVPGSLAAPDSSGESSFGRFLAPGDAHPDFGFTYSRTLQLETGLLFQHLAEDPEAFATLYDAERAYFAYYLERLTRQGGDPDFHADKRWKEDKATMGPDEDLDDIVRHIGALMGVRANGARDGGISDLGSFDATVRSHTRGAYRAAPRQLTSRPPMSGIAARPVSGALRGDPMDGRRQLFTVLDAWAEARGVPAERVAALRQWLDDAYVKGLRYGVF
ncbi:hypothetical protein [Streptomyces sp. NPDC002671]